MTPPTPHPAIYDTTRLVVRLLGTVVFRVRVTGNEHVPTEGGFILTPVHRSHLDPPLCSLLTRRRLRFLAKESLFSNRLLGGYLANLGAFRVRRGEADMGAFRNCLAILRSGEGLVLFPEGTRGSGKVVGPIEEGAIKLSARTKSPIVPVAIVGAEEAMPPGARLVRPSRIDVVAGEPLDGSSLTADTLREQLQHLFDEIQRAHERPPMDQKRNAS